MGGAAAVHTEVGPLAHRGGRGCTSGWAGCPQNLLHVYILFIHLRPDHKADETFGWKVKLDRYYCLCLVLREEQVEEALEL